MNKSVKYLIEGIVNFNPVDYQDEDPDLIGNQTISNLTYKYFPKDKELLLEIIIEKLKENIKEPYLNDIDTSLITDMSELFSAYKEDYLRNNYIYSSEIKKLDLSGWDTSKVTDMNSMFFSCSSLETVNLSGWNTSKVIDMEHIFLYCELLKKLDISDWNTSKVRYMSYMFYACESLEELDISGWNTSSITKMAWMFEGCNKSIIPDWYKIKKGLTENKLNFNPIDYSDEEPDLIGNQTISSLAYTYFPKTKEDLQKIIIEKLEENIEEPYLNDINTSEITDMSELFSDYKKSYLRNTYIHSSEIKKLDLSCWDTSNVTNMQSMFSFCESLEKLDLSGWNTSNVTDMLFMFYNCVSLKELDLSGWDISSETDMTWMFKGCNISIIPNWYKRSLTENKLNFNPVDYSDEDIDLIDNQTVSNLTYKYFPQTRRDLEKIIIDKIKKNSECPYLNDIDISEITNLSNLFANMEDGYLLSVNVNIWNELKELDLSCWDTSNVNDMSGMFYGCEFLEKLNISTWDTSNVINMSMMFSDCESLKHLDLSSFNTSNVTNMSLMFSKCSSLIDLDLFNWDISKVTDISFMFNNCKSLKCLDLSNWNTFNVTGMNYIFGNCESLKKLDLTGWDISNITNMFAIFLNCESLKELNLSGWNITTVKQMKEIFYGCEKSLIPDLYRAKLTESKLNFNPADYNDDETDLITQDEIFSFAPKATNIQELKSLIAERLKVNPKNPDLRNIDVSDVKTMKNLFHDHYFTSCGIEGLNLSTWDVSKVRNTSGMFRGLRLLKTIKLPKSMKDARPVDMSYMFASCSSLQELDVLKFNTCKVTDMSHMFEGCASLTNLQLSYFNTSNVKDMSFMFSCCYLLATLNLRYFDTSNVQKMNNMFYCCQLLEGLDLSNFNTNNVTNMSGMFWNCGFLTTLNVSGFVTKNVTNMSRMFAWCKSLKFLDLSSFTIDNIASLELMFSDCYSLEKLDLSGFEDPGKPYISKSMFSGCSSLKKENLITNYNRIKQMIKLR